MIKMTPSALLVALGIDKQLHDPFTMQAAKGEGINDKEAGEVNKSTGVDFDGVEYTNLILQENAGQAFPRTRQTPFDFLALQQQFPALEINPVGTVINFYMPNQPGFKFDLTLPDHTQMIQVATATDDPSFMSTIGMSFGGAAQPYDSLNVGPNLNGGFIILNQNQTPQWWACQNKRSVSFVNGGAQNTYVSVNCHIQV